jgi:hypothetical protein
MEPTPGIDPNLLLAKMGEGNNNDDKSWWLILLLLLYGRKGFGSGDEDGTGIRTPATLADLNATQNSLQSCMTAQTQALSERTLDITRDQATNALRNETGQMALQQAIAAANAQNLVGQKDITATLAECCCNLGISIKDVERTISDQCCETRNAINVQGLQNLNAINTQGLQTQNAIQYQGLNTVNAIEKCCCDTQNAIALQTNTLERAICNDGQLTRSLITDNRMQDLQTQLGICRDENSNLRQTVALSEQINRVCGPPPRCHPVDPCPHPHHGGGRGNGGPPGPP